jgi:hypothetical protein
MERPTRKPAELWAPSLQKSLDQPIMRPTGAARSASSRDFASGPVHPHHAADAAGFQQPRLKRRHDGVHVRSPPEWGAAARGFALPSFGACATGLSGIEAFRGVELRVRTQGLLLVSGGADCPRHSGVWSARRPTRLDLIPLPAMLLCAPSGTPGPRAWIPTILERPRGQPICTALRGGSPCGGPSRSSPTTNAPISRPG